MTFTTKNKDLQALERIALAQDWYIERSNGGHLKWYPPNGDGFVLTAHTPSGGRHIENIKSQLTKAGLDLKLGETKVTRRRRAKQLGGGEKFPIPGQDQIKALFIENTAYHNREVALMRAKIIMDMPDATDEEVAQAIMDLPKVNHQMVLQLVISDEEPSKTCICGRIFTRYLGAAMHRSRCKVARGEVPTPQPIEQPIPTATTTVKEEPPTMGLPGVGKIVCPTCSDSFDSKQALTGHMNVHEMQACKYCTVEYTLNSIGRHESLCESNPERNSNRRKRKVKCPYCEKELQAVSLPPHINMYCPVARYNRKKNQQEITPATSAPTTTTTTLDPQDAEMDALLDLVTQGRPISFSLSNMRVVNQWMEATRKLLGLFDGEE